MVHVPENDTVRALEITAQMWDRIKREGTEDLARAMATPLWAEAVTWLRGYLSAEVLAQIRDAIAKHDPNWPAGYHMWWGMGVRNALREHGFGETAMGVENLDNIYVALVEEAACSTPEQAPRWRLESLAKLVQARGRSILADFPRGSQALDCQQAIEEAGLRTFALMILVVGLLLVVVLALVRWGW